MRSMRILSLVLGLGTAMCGSKEHSKPATRPDSTQAGKPATRETSATPSQEESITKPLGWIEFSSSYRKFLVVRIADAGHRPSGGFEGSALLGKPAMTLYYVILPHDYGSVEIVKMEGEGRSSLGKPRKVNRMPGSALYAFFLADPSRTVTLVFKSADMEEGFPIPAASLQALPFFWSGEPATIAFEEVPGWMEGAGP